METSILVFVIEDEQAIRDLLEEALKDGGFSVATAALGEDAIPMLEVPNADYRALVTDVNLSPGKLTGWDVATRARELHPGLPVVFITGTDAHDWASKGVPNSFLVAKPFAPAQIVTAISQLLNQGKYTRSLNPGFGPGLTSAATGAHHPLATF
jgi:DNA-binding NtrC family response regulator